MDGMINRQIEGFVYSDGMVEGQMDGRLDGQMN